MFLKTVRLCMHLIFTFLVAHITYYAMCEVVQATQVVVALYIAVMDLWNKTSTTCKIAVAMSLHLYS